MLLVGIVEKDDTSIVENPDQNFWLRCSFVGPFADEQEARGFIKYHREKIHSNCEYRWKNLVSPMRVFDPRHSNYIPGV